MSDRLSAYCGAFSVHHPSLYKTAVRGGIGIGTALCGIALLGALSFYPLGNWLERIQPIPSEIIFGGMAGVGAISAEGAVVLCALVHTKEGKKAASKAAEEKQ